MKAPLIAVARHRLGVDGDGVTTLVAFHGCPLRCRYCLNSQCWDEQQILRWTTPEALTEELMQDHLYFLATGGGVCLGGGEPLLHAAFIADFCKLCPPEWNIYLESSLQASRQQLEAVIPYIHHYYIDVKDLDPHLYKAYTGGSVSPVMDNLRFLAEQQQQSRVTIRLPLIASYNTHDNRLSSQQHLTAMGYSDFDFFDYQYVDLFLDGRR